MEISFKDKVAAVTDAGSGIGSETAKKLALVMD
jgi:NADP-dependent 3-hydroxy acid dehydrogenase YdfG